MKIGISNLDHIVPILKIISQYEEVRDKDIETTLSVLDVGCGKGVYGYLLRAMYGWNKLILTGVDPYVPEGFNDAMGIIYDSIYHKDIQRFLEINNEVFSVILANHVMEHLNKDEAFMAIKRFKLLADLVLIGLPKARFGHKYSHANSTDYHTHKWGCMDKDFWNLGLHYAKTVKGNELFWWAREDLEPHFLHLNKGRGGLF